MDARSRGPGRRPPRARSRGPGRRPPRARSEEGSCGARAAAGRRNGLRTQDRRRCPARASHGSRDSGGPGGAGFRRRSGPGRSGRRGLFRPGRFPTADLAKNIETLFTKLNKDYAGKIIGIPYIGCGIAGGDWKEVSEIINRVTPDVKIVVCYMEQ